jgi:type VI secretion system protein ImpL
MLSRLKGVLVIVIGLLLVAAVIWWGWPLLGITIRGERTDTELVRLILIGLVIGGWVVFRVVKWLRARSASNAMMAAVVKSAPKEQPSADAQRLRDRFEEAVAMLKQNQRRGHSLYELPWYVIIGAPGAGKTTVLVNSGLQFPTAQRGQSAALRGIGGTRNCDWWFSDEAVFLDTAGRYTTQDSDAGADSAGWGEFLSLLKKYRQRRPLNGVLVAMSALDLMTQNSGAREAHVAAVRRRIEELNDRLGIRLPVYLLITKSDLIAGFSEYFDDLTQEGRAQVWGVTFDAERGRNAEAAESYPAEFDALVTRLNERVLARVDDERDPRRRVLAFGFPQQMASLRQGLTQFVRDVFASTRFERAILLRGVYFTSGTQEGTPVDRLLGALGRRFGMAADVAPGSRGKAYFIERLLKNVVIPESGLAGVNRRLELRKGALQLAAYCGMIVLAVLVIMVLTMNYRDSRSYLGDVEQALADVRTTEPVGPSSSNAAIVSRLDALRMLKDVATKSYLPLYRRWALNSGRSVGDQAGLAYSKNVNAVLIKRLAATLEERIGPGAQAEDLYDGLRAYLVLGKEHRPKLEKAFFAVAWSDEGGDLAPHAEWLLDHPDAMQTIDLKADLVEQAQRAMRNVPPERLVYRDVEKAVEGGDWKKFRLSEEAGTAPERVLRFKSGRPLSYLFPAMHTKEVFHAMTDNGAAQLRNIVASRTKYDWVWGAQGAPGFSTSEVTEKVLDRYEDEYIHAWDGIVNDVGVVSIGSLSSLQDLLSNVTGVGSPVRGLLQVVKKHTLLYEPPKEGAAKKTLDAATSGVLSRFGQTKGAPRGLKITDYFAKYHTALGADVDPLIDALGEMKKQLAPFGDKPGTKPPSAETQQATREIALSLESRSGTLPPALASMTKQIASGARGVVGKDIASSFQSVYAQDVVTRCQEHVPGNYPFVRNSANSIRVDDFAALFRYGGVFEQFEANQLRQYTDGPRYKKESPVTDPFILRQFDAARRIREAFFSQGKERPEVELGVEILDTSVPVQSGNASRFTLELGSTVITKDAIDRDPVNVTWPGSRQLASATWRGGVNIRAEPQDEWALFRLLDKGELRHPDGGQTSLWKLVLTKDGNSADISIDARRKNNALASLDVLRSFSCGPSGR